MAIQSLFASLLLIVVSLTHASEYNVWIGGDRRLIGLALLEYFPSMMKIHVGDRVNFVKNSHEMHTVTFLGNHSAYPFLVQEPDGNMAIHPDVLERVRPDMMREGSYANSGLFMMGDGEHNKTGPYNYAKAFMLEFGEVGMYHYHCMVHDQVMTGVVEVVHDDERVSPPKIVYQDANRLLEYKLQKGNDVYGAAVRNQRPPVKNPDGTYTHHVTVGWTPDYKKYPELSQIELNAFFPRRLKAYPGDHIVWEFQSRHMLQQTITFLNGMPEPKEYVSYGEYIIVNPVVLMPHSNGILSRDGLIHSGILQVEGDNVPRFELEVGDHHGLFRYVSLTNEELGMYGEVHVEKKR